jgi:hypothetical protein
MPNPQITITLPQSDWEDIRTMLRRYADDQDALAWEDTARDARAAAAKLEVQP